MIPKKYRKELDRIIERYQQGNATAEETRFIEDYYNLFDSRPNISEQLTAEEKEQWKQTLLAKIQEGIAKGEPAPVIPMYRRTIFRIAAAACIVLVMGYGLWVYQSQKSKVKSEKVEAVAVHDVPAPTNTRAVITLADGSKVYLDSASNGTIAQQNNVSVVKNENGEIIYSHEGAKTQSEIAYNTMFNPRGSKVISLTLSDGTKVWLNSESSLKYPIAFNGDMREVEITGEAFFEVKHNSQQPFKVHLPNGAIVEDIGTSFNINAYSDEQDIRTTLIEGSVIVRRESSNVKLKPGEQAYIHDSRFTIDRPDLDEVLAWKNGMFSFKSADITSIMRQLEKWYDLDVEYNTIPKEKFHVEMNRATNLSNVFKILEETGGVHFKIEGRRITVMK
jgi:ferric-dicitrate binding protein FerR (iron transport regulator)